MKLLFVILILQIAFAKPVKRRLLKGELTCVTGEYLIVENGEEYCAICSENCDGNCVKNDGCTKCKAGFFLDGEGGCDSCMTGCAQCENKEVCEKCSDDAYYMEGNCYMNPTNCSKAENGKGCIECDKGYFLTNVTNGKCTTCGEGCAEGQCSQTTTEGCQKVKDTGSDPSKGYYISGGTAWKCDDNCELCYEKTRDQNIYSGKIPPGAKNGCLQCKPGYFWFESAAGDMKYCKKCDIQCKTCSGVEYNCGSCDDDRELYFAYTNANGTNVNSCRPKQTKNCKEFGTDNQCTKCNDGFHLDHTGYCLINHPEYNSTSKENQCGEAFALYNGSCVPRSENCESYNKVTGLCEKCEGLTYLQDGFCVKCHEKCVDCDNKNGVCYHCQPDYYSNGTKTCYPDVTSTEDGANEKLWLIGTNDKPIRCLEDKYVDFKNVTRSCKSCSQYCLEESIPQGEGENATEIKISYCDTAFGCLRCKEGFYVTPNGECSSCSPHCALCDQTLGCLHCLGDTVMVDGRCEYSGAAPILTLLILLILAFAI